MIIPPDELKEKEAAKDRQRAGLEQKRVKEEASEARRSTRRFLFLRTGAGIFDLDAKTLARLIYLSTFLKAQSANGTLYRTERSEMHKADLPELLGLSRQTCSRFLENARAYVTIQDDLSLSLDTEAFARGELPHNYVSRQKLFIGEFRSLYASVPYNLHRLIGAVFKLAPYVNREYNIVCEDADESDLSLVKPLPMKEICTLLGIPKKESSTFQSEISSLHFLVNGIEESVCVHSRYGENKSQSGLFINPKLMYVGHAPNKAYNLGAFSCVAGSGPGVSGNLDR